MIEHLLKSNLALSHNTAPIISSFPAKRRRSEPRLGGTHRTPEKQKREKKSSTNELKSLSSCTSCDWKLMEIKISCQTKPSRINNSNFTRVLYIATLLHCWVIQTKNWKKINNNFIWFTFSFIVLCFLNMKVFDQAWTSASFHFKVLAYTYILELLQICNYSETNTYMWVRKRQSGLVKKFIFPASALSQLDFLIRAEKEVTFFSWKQSIISNY